MFWCDLSAGRAHALVCWKMSSGPCTQFSVPSDWRWVFAVIVSSPAQGRFGIQVRLSPGARAIMQGVDCHKKWRKGLECGRNVFAFKPHADIQSSLQGISLDDSEAWSQKRYSNPREKEWKLGIWPCVYAGLASPASTAQGPAGVQHTVL